MDLPHQSDGPAAPVKPGYETDCQNILPCNYYDDHVKMFFTRKYIYIGSISDLKKYLCSFFFSGTLDLMHF